MVLPHGPQEGTEGRAGAQQGAAAQATRRNAALRTKMDQQQGKTQPGGHCLKTRQEDSFELKQKANETITRMLLLPSQLLTVFQHLLTRCALSSRSALTQTIV